MSKKFIFWREFALANQIRLLQNFALLLQIFALLLQIFALLSLLFGINCTEIDQSHSSIISIYIINITIIIIVIINLFNFYLLRLSDIEAISQTVEEHTKKVVKMCYLARNIKAKMKELIGNGKKTQFGESFYYKKIFLGKISDDEFCHCRGAAGWYLCQVYQ